MKSSGERSFAPLAVSIAAFTIVLAASSAWLQRGTDDLMAHLVITVWLGIFAGVSALVAGRHRSNPVGWLLLGAAFCVAAGLFATGYAKYTTEIDPGSLPLGRQVAWLGLWLPSPAVGLIVMSLLHFPNGSLLSGRWKPVVWALGASMSATTIGYAVKPGPIDNVRTLTNPIEVGFGEELFKLANGPFSMVTVACAVAAIVSLFIRMRRAEGPERQQMKWFVYAVAVFPLFFLSAMVTDAVLDAQFGSGDHYVDFFLNMAGASLIPLSMGVSIMRYRLYDIDLLINRTLVYGTLTALLGASYLGGVVVLQRLLDSVTAESDLAVAGSTLAVAAIARPALRRIQEFIDKRFYRRKYDAAETLQEFAFHLREEVNLDTLTGELVQVVARTMQPRHASLWLRTQGPA